MSTESESSIQAAALTGAARWLERIRGSCLSAGLAVHARHQLASTAANPVRMAGVMVHG